LKNFSLELSRWIKLIDEAIFGKQSLEVKILNSSSFTEFGEKDVEEVVEKARQRGAGCGLIHTEKVKFYFIFPENLEKKVALELRRRKCPSAGREWEELPSFTEEELIIGIAAHEVRHRVQKEFRIRMIEPEDAENVLDPELEALIRFIAKVLERYPPQFSEPKGELDATVIEWIVSKLWHEGEKDVPRLVALIKESGEKIIKRRVFPPSFYYLKVVSPQFSIYLFSNHFSLYRLLDPFQRLSNPHDTLPRILVVDPSSS
jgi:hypothetical protein